MSKINDLDSALQAEIAAIKTEYDSTGTFDFPYNESIAEAIARRIDAVVETWNEDLPPRPPKPH